jgi:nucleolar GTP-binding protein
MVHHPLLTMALIPAMLTSSFCCFRSTARPLTTFQSKTVGVHRLLKATVQQSDSTNNNSPPSTTVTTKNNNNSNTNTNNIKTRILQRNSGGLRRLPVVANPTELVNRARKVAWRVKPDTTLRNMRARVQKQGAETLNAVTQALCLPLRDVVKGYQYEWNRLHPFERVVADLTARARQNKDGLVLQQVLDDIHEARKMVLEASKDWIAKVKNAESSKESDLAMQQGIESLIQLFNDYAAPPVTSLMTLQKSLRSAPAVQLDVPAVVLVGAPNVGKSSIVRAISSATPEVNNYPFTTRGMTLGHVEVFWSDTADIVQAKIPKTDRKQRSHGESPMSTQYAFSQLCQVMDSPGLLVRPDDKRNEMELLTLAAMQHLPTAVMYVLDLTGQAGDACSSIADQLQLRQEMRRRFPRRPWIDVLSKVDLGLEAGVIQQLEQVLGDAPYIQLSIHTGIGVSELRTEVLRMLGEVRVVLDAMAVVDSRSVGNSNNNR